MKEKNDTNEKEVILCPREMRRTIQFLLVPDVVYVITLGTQETGWL